MIQHTYWYDEVHELCKHWAKETDHTVPQVAGIIAVLSPMVPWDTNLRWAYEVLTENEPKNYMLEVNLKKALRIKSGEHPSQVLGGLKVRSFYANILRPHGTGSITIDRHMLRLIGHSKDQVTPKQYHVIAERYKQQARLHNLKPCAYQALLWCLTRGGEKEYVTGN